MNNPYIFRGPVHDPTMFFGRRHEMNEIAAFLRGNQSISIVGPRKIGKTSLLFHLMRPQTAAELGLGGDNLLAYLDCEVLGDGGHEEILGQFAAEVAAALDERGLPPEPALDKAVERPSRLSFEAAVRRLNQRGLRVVLILDEFERLSTNDHLDVNFFNALRSAAGRYQLAYVTASARPLIQLTYSERSHDILSSPFFNIFAPLFPGLLPEDEARQLIAEPARRAGQPFAPPVQDFVYRLVGGHPLAVQVACFHAWDTPDDKAEIERQTMLELSPHFQYYWHNLSLEEQHTLRQITHVSTHAQSDTTLRGLLRDLVQKCLLLAEGGAYRYPSQALANFVASQTSPAASIARGSSLAGTRLGTYEVIELLGRGGMAEVYKGRHPRLDRTVAIKILSPSLAAEADFRQRFEREARSVAALRHPNIVQVFDFGDVEETFYMVMEYIEGVDMARLLREGGAIKLAPARSILDGLASALDYAHAQGLVHRDVKPSNVMLRPLVEPAASFHEQPEAFSAVLTDFGIAKIRASDTAATRSGMLMGTLDYMAPEQVRVAGTIDGRADVYALGVMLYQMLTGQLPFQGDNPGAVMLAHLQQQPPDPRTVAPELPDGVAQAILRAMAKDADERFASAGEFAAAVAR